MTMHQTTRTWLRGCVQHLKGLHPTQDVDFLTFGLAAQYLRNQFGDEWANEALFGPHPTVSRDSRKDRAFMRAEATSLEDRFRNMQRTLRLAELLFNMQHVPGIDKRIESLRGAVEPSTAELEAGAFLLRRETPFRFVTPSGKRGADYDAEIDLSNAPPVPCEMKCKLEATELTKGTLLASLNAARKQLPRSALSLVFLKTPESWLRRQDWAGVMKEAVDEFFRSSKRVVAVVTQWEEQLLQPQGSLFLYRFRLESRPPSPSVSPAIAELLTSLAGRQTAKWVSFRAVATEVLNAQTAPR